MIDANVMHSFSANADILLTEAMLDEITLAMLGKAQDDDLAAEEVL